MQSSSKTSHSTTHVTLFSRGPNAFGISSGLPAFVAAAVTKFCSLVVTSVLPRRTCVRCTAQTTHTKKAERNRETQRSEWP
jgi:hypothetical protein